MKYIARLACVFFSFFCISISYAQTPTVTVYSREGCPHCAAEKEFLSELQKTTSFDLAIIEVTEPAWREKFLKFTKLHDLAQVTPITQIGEKIIIWFGTAETTGKDIIEALAQPNQSEKTENDTLRLPFIGEIHLKDFTLFSLSAILGLIDGFNPCAMWALITFLMVLINLWSRKKMIQVAGIFLLAETVMYGLILNIWLKTWDFVSLDTIVTPLIGVLAIGGGSFFLWEAIKSDGTCQVTNPAQRSKIVQRIKHIASSPLTFVTLGSILILAFSINIIEFACSIGLPQTFTKILDMNHLGFLSRQWYILIYMIGYMIDDLVVFSMAIISFSMIHHSKKLTFYSQLLGGILMILLGLILIFNRSFLVF